MLKCADEDRTQDPEQQPNNRGCNNDESSLWKRSFVRRNRGIDDLKKRPLSCLIELGNFQLPRQDIEDRLAVLDCAKPADVFEPRLRNAALGNNKPVSIG